MTLVKPGARIGLFALCGVVMFGLVALASAIESAVPLFFVWIPAAAIMLIERRAGTPVPPALRPD
jgi:uncharacterized membrane protein YfbV (UPF0208 family)